jgi:hypothetical protein
MSYTIVSASPPLCAFSRVGHKDSSFRLGDSDLVMFHILVNKCAYLCELSSGGAGCNTLTPVTAFANDPSVQNHWYYYTFAEGCLCLMYSLSKMVFCAQSDGQRPFLRFLRTVGVKAHPTKVSL